MSFKDGCIKFFLFLNGFYKIGNMHAIQHFTHSHGIRFVLNLRGRLGVLQQFTGTNLKYLIFIATGGEHSSLFSVEYHTTPAAPFLKVVATPSLPGNGGVVGKLKSYCLGIRRFPIILICVSST